MKNKKKLIMTVLGLAMLGVISSCTVNQDELTTYEDFQNLELEGENSLKLDGLTANRKNQSPVAIEDDGTNHAVDQTRIYSVLDNDFDPDGDTIKIIEVLGGSPNIVSWNGGNTITVTRRNAFRRTIYYQISDGNGGTSWGTISLLKLGGNNG